MAASKSVIPRFLLPLQSPLWRGLRAPPVSQHIRVRYASSSQADGKPIVLEKPAKFNPPSHGARLKSKALPKHYSPPLSEAEIKVRSQRSYPGMMAPEGSWQHWFWHSKLLHTFITMVRFSFFFFATRSQTFFEPHVLISNRAPSSPWPSTPSS